MGAIGAGMGYLIRSIDRLIMSFTAVIAAMFALKPRAALIRSTMSSAGLILGKAT